MALATSAMQMPPTALRHPADCGASRCGLAAKCIVSFDRGRTRRMVDGLLSVLAHRLAFDVESPHCAAAVLSLSYPLAHMTLVQIGEPTAGVGRATSRRRTVSPTAYLRLCGRDPTGAGQRSARPRLGSHTRRRFPLHDDWRRSFGASGCRRDGKQGSALEPGHRANPLSRLMRGRRRSRHCVQIRRPAASTCWPTAGWVVLIRRHATP